MNISLLILSIVARVFILTCPLEGKVCESFMSRCSFSRPCGLDNAVCQLGKCECLSPYLYIDGRCEEPKTIFVLNRICYNDYDCRETAHSVCNFDRQCICKSGYYNQGDKCVSWLNSSCKNSTDCEGNNLECVSGECKCNQGSYEYHDRCLPYASSIPECYNDPSCPGELCDYSKCRCDRGYILSNERCVGKLESRCTSSLKCYDKVMTCVSGRCQCAPGYIRWLNAYCVENQIKK